MGKKKIGRYDISNYILNNNFMTEKEILNMYSLLRRHMYIKYGKYDEDVIHRTILQGLNKSHQYVPGKASMLVWFQSILRNIYLQEIDPKYNRAIKHHYSLDWTSEGDEQNINILTEVSMKEDNSTYDIKDDLLSEFNDKLKLIIEEGDYPMLKYKLQLLTTQQISDITGINQRPIYTKLAEERKRLMKDIKGIKESSEMIEGRINRNGKRGKGKGNYGEGRTPKIYIRKENTECRKCKVIFIKPFGSGNLRTCPKCNINIIKI